MQFKDVISITGKGGLFQLISARQDGLIVTPLGENKRTFISSRKHMFTPLENIGIYLDSGETIELAEVLLHIADQPSIPHPNASTEELRKFFRQVVEDYDEERVYPSDIKKIIKWQSILADHKVEIKPYDADEEE
ncbi:MAG: DUF5606 domain-containing protein [Saprospiraceae bacterium]|nr:DUF5606 domain-containing protein [Saprospiraceae bacterium]